MNPSVPTLFTTIHTLKLPSTGVPRGGQCPFAELELTPET